MRPSRQGTCKTVGQASLDDIVWHSLGYSRFSRDYTGRDDVFGLFGTLFEETGGSFWIELHDVLANDDRVRADESGTE